MCFELLTGNKQFNLEYLMATKLIDCKGLKCPMPSLKMLSEANKMAQGDILEVVADCSTFESDVRSWCQRTGKALLLFRNEGESMRCQVRI
jgi:tRNA 2-thiouridine synthesizing protein A